MNAKKSIPHDLARDGADLAPSDDELEGQRTGRVKFDDRGNAIWEWSIATGAFGREVTTDRLKRLENPTLAIADDTLSLSDPGRNPLGAKRGYNPYDSVKVGKTSDPPKPKKRDLRRLGEWLKLKKQVALNKASKD